LKANLIPFELISSLKVTFHIAYLLVSM